MPIRTFVAGETLTASNLNAYLMNQAVIVCTSGTRPSSPIEGMTIYETDTDKLLTYDGSAWTLPKNVAGGLVVAPAVVTASQSGITTVTDLTGLTVTFTPTVATRRIKLTGALYIQSTAVADTAKIRIAEGATQIQERQIQMHATAGNPIACAIEVTISPTVAAHTYKLTLERSIGTGSLTNTAAATYPSEFRAEDIGGV